MPNVRQKLMKERAYGPYTLKKRFRRDDVSILQPKKKPLGKRILDLDERTFFGRRLLSWLAILLFLLLFYSILVLVFVGMYFAAYKSRFNENMPQILHTQPGLLIEPVIGNEIIPTYHYKMRADTTFEPYRLKLLRFLKKLKAPSARFEKCEGDNYGIDSRNLCIFLKLNAIIGWKAETYQSSTEMPSSTPLEMRRHLSSLSLQDRQNRIWFSCNTTGNDIKAEYHPDRSINKKFLEFSTKHHPGNDDFERVISVQFNQIPLDTKVYIHCYAWAKNIVVDDANHHGKGKVEMEILIQSSRKKN